jgi:hypothetical protein
MHFANGAITRRNHWSKGRASTKIADAIISESSAQYPGKKIYFHRFVFTRNTQSIT